MAQEHGVSAAKKEALASLKNACHVLPLDKHQYNSAFDVIATSAGPLITDLPTEVLVAIFTWLLAPKPSVIRFVDRTLFRNARHSAGPLDSRLLRVCRAFYNAGTESLYRMNRFEFDNLRTARKLPNPEVIRELRIDDEASRPRPQEWKALLGQMTRLDYLCLSLKSFTSHEKGKQHLTAKLIVDSCQCLIERKGIGLKSNAQTRLRDARCNLQMIVNVFHFEDDGWMYLKQNDPQRESLGADYNRGMRWTKDEKDLFKAMFVEYVQSSGECA